MLAFLRFVTCRSAIRIYRSSAGQHLVRTLRQIGYFVSLVLKLISSLGSKALVESPRSVTALMQDLGNPIKFPNMYDLLRADGEDSSAVIKFRTSLSAHPGRKRYEPIFCPGKALIDFFR